MKPAIFVLGVGLALALASDVYAQSASRPYSYQVELAQHRLAALGYRLGSVDGRLGKQTVEAIRSFQLDSQLPTTGRPDVPTLRALGQAAPGKISPAKLTTHGIAEFINRRTEACVSNHPSAILPNKMSHGLRVKPRDATLILRTSYEVVPYDNPQPSLKPVRHTRRYQVSSNSVDLKSIGLEREAAQLASGCYRLSLDCFEGESCITEGYATQKKAFSAIFATKPEDVRRLRSAWRLLLSRLGASKEKKPADQPEPPPADQTAVATPPTSQGGD